MASKPKKKGIVKIQRKDKRTGRIEVKDYEVVASRLERFVEDNPEYRLLTEATFRDPDMVMMKCSIDVYNDGRVIRSATAHAFESKTASFINQTSYVENCETSAVGRCLALLGYGGSEIASAEEVANAVKQQLEDPDPSEYPYIEDDQLPNWVMPLGKYKDFPLGKIVEHTSEKGKAIGRDYLEAVCDKQPRTIEEKYCLGNISRFIALLEKGN